MDRLVGAALAFGLVGVVVMFMSGINMITYNITENITHSTNAASSLAQVLNATNTANLTLAQFLPIVAIAVAGGLALGYLIFFVRGSIGGGAIM